MFLYFIVGPIIVSYLSGRDHSSTSRRFIGHCPALAQSNFSPSFLSVGLDTVILGRFLHLFSIDGIYIVIHVDI